MLKKSGIMATIVCATRNTAFSRSNNVKAKSPLKKSKQMRSKAILTKLGHDDFIKENIFSQIQNNDLMKFYQEKIDPVPVLCVPQNVSDQLRFLLDHQTEFFIDNSVLFKGGDDKVNARLRDTAVHNLYTLHQGYFGLSPQSFSQAVNLIDRFVVKVKVKPKYMACLSTACYYIATQHLESPENRPDEPTLVTVSRCGGTVNDFRRMVVIIREKLRHNLAAAVTPLCFIEVLRPLLDGATTGSGPGPSLADTAVANSDRVVTSALYCRYRPLVVALACVELAATARGQSGAVRKVLDWVTTVGDVANGHGELLACRQWAGRLLLEIATRPHSRPEELVWTLSRRTAANLKCAYRPCGELAPIEEMAEEGYCSGDEDDVGSAFSDGDLPDYMSDLSDVDDLSIKQLFA